MSNKHVNILLSMKREDKEKKDEFLDRLNYLLTKHKYYVSSHKNEESGKEEKLIGDITCWFNQDGSLVYNNDKELKKYFQDIDDATNYRSHAYQNFIENVNINHIAFDACDKMKYKSSTLNTIYQKICKMNEEETDLSLKDLLFQDVFQLCSDFSASLEINITTECEIEEERIQNERSRGGTDLAKREFPENKVIKIYRLCVSDENAKIFQRKLYQTLMKHKYYVNHISEVCDFTKWYSSKNATNVYVIKKLKYYFDDILDDDAKRAQLFLVHRNTPFHQITSYYEHNGMGYTKDEIEKALALAKKDENIFYTKLFELFIEYDMILEIKSQ
jgi:hypothetical protein